MNATATNDELRRLGIEPGYTDTSGRSRRSPGPSLAAVARHLRAGDHGDVADDRMVFVRLEPGSRPAIPPGHLGSVLVLEDGTEVGVLDGGALSADIPLGYHWLHAAGGGEPTQLVVTPGRCHLPYGLRAWGWAVQLYSARSGESWGMGDLADAARIGRSLTDTSRRVGGTATPLLLVNPLHAVNAGPKPAVSPYSAGSRCFYNPIYLRVEEVTGFAPTPQLQGLAESGRAANTGDRIDRARTWAAKEQALTLLWDAAGTAEHQRVDAALATDPVLRAHSSFNAQCERAGDRWNTWPAELRHPRGSGWPRLDDATGARARFHAWLQLLVRDQLDQADQVVPLLLDLAIGAGPGGFDTWYWQDLFVLDGTSIGAPPDDFNTQGQNWTLPPMDPWRLRGARYEPIVRMLRAGLAHSSGLRIDHVLGLFRQFWVPAGHGPADGVYVRQRAEELLDLVALESVRAEAVVVGEDLGTVGPGVRQQLAERNLLSYRVMSLEETPPAEFPAQSLASFTTHDLATVPGLWTGADLEAQQRLDRHPNVEGTEHARRRLAEQIGVGLDAPVAEVVAGAYEALADAPSAIVLGALEDTAGVVDRPNMPGTTDAWPNWVQALPQPIDELLAQPLTVEVAEILARR